MNEVILFLKKFNNNININKLTQNYFSEFNDINITKKDDEGRRKDEIITYSLSRLKPLPLYLLKSPVARRFFLRLRSWLWIVPPSLGPWLPSYAYVESWTPCHQNYKNKKN